MREKLFKDRGINEFPFIDRNISHFCEILYTDHYAIVYLFLQKKCFEHPSNIYMFH